MTVIAVLVLLAGLVLVLAGRADTRRDPAASRLPFTLGIVLLAFGVSFLTRGLW